MKKLLPGITVLVSALNEEAYIHNTVTELLNSVRRHYADFEVILMDDGSTDSTGMIMDRLATEHSEVRVFHNERNLGIGAGYKRAIENARYQTITDFPGDDSFDMDSLDKYWEATKSNAITIGCRANQARFRTGLRAFLSRMFTATVNTIFGLHLRDVHGLFAVPVEEVRKLPLDYAGYSYQVEILVHLLSGGRAHAQVIIGLKPDDSARSSALRMKTLRDVAVMFAKLFWTVRLFQLIKR